MYIIIIIVSLFLASSCNKTNSEKPNVIIILTDDQGFGDFSMNGNPWVETPFIDNLADESIYIPNFYVSPVCAPTRASILTGRHYQRTGVTGVTRGQENMSLEEQTIADIFRNNNYSTGLFGKWHNGAHYPYHPNGRGFDEFYGFCSGHWTNYFNTTLEKNGVMVRSNGYITDDLTDKAIEFIESNTQNRKPFFCFLSINTPHSPLQVPDEYFNKYKSKGIDDFNAAIYGMCENIDDNIGRLIKKLDMLEIRENTIIVYLSDNGPLNNRFNDGLKGLKASVDEGGVKTPFILNYRGKITPAVVEGIAAHIDILPTLVDLTGINVDYKNPVDGKSLVPMINEEVQQVHTFLPEYLNGKYRLRTTRYLLVNESLYDLKYDPGQNENVRDTYPEIYDSLHHLYKHWYSQIEMTVPEAYPIPVGYATFRNSYLPAHEAILHPSYTRNDPRPHEISYHSYYGWANDWIDYWTDTSAYITWDIAIVETGTFSFTLDYNCKPMDLGVELALIVQDRLIKKTVTKPFYSDLKDLPDRVEIVAEAPEKDWSNLHLGELNLKEGRSTISLRSLRIPGEKSIEVKGLQVKRID